MLKLSICIPTYNREEYLEELIISIVDQVTADVKEKIEICISDNASTDGTEKMIRKYCKYIDITYHKNAQNIGPDSNYLKAVDLAKGEYCWLMGSDDAINSNSIEYILNEINDFPNVSVFLSNRVKCDFYMNRISDESFVNESVLGKTIDFNDNNEIIKYFNECRSLGAIFSYLSSIVVKREKWQQIEYDSSFTGTAYSHAYILLKILFNGEKLKFLRKSLPLNRSDNDSFYIDLKQRVYLDLRGYLKLSNQIIENEDIRNAFISVIRRKHTLKALLKISIIQSIDKNEMVILEEVGYSRSVILLLKFANMNSNFLRKLYNFKKSIEG